MFLEKEFAAARRGRRLACILFDLDNFKSYNDTAGHQAGDEALHAFGEVLHTQTRAMNLAARYGGDEFITILADVDRAGALTHAERIAEAVEQHPLLQSAGIRTSAGVAVYDLRMSSPADLIRAADADLYARKAIRRVLI
jgi:diguanylate cyclase (GGDEF)-like protein